MAVREIIGVLVGVIVLAGLSVALKNGSQTASVIEASSNGFSNVIRSATAG